MNKYVWIWSLLLPFFTLRSENLVTLSQQAEALWEARDYTSATHIYEQLLTTPLSEWQQARIHYNLGTIQLSQNHPQQALTYFHKINPLALSLPKFGRHLFLNEGIAYWQYADLLASSHSSLELQITYVQQSLRAFQQARNLECQVQLDEQNSPQNISSFTCQSTQLLDQWTKAAQEKLHALYQQKYQNWIEQADTPALVNLLTQLLNIAITHLKETDTQKLNSTDQISFLTQFQKQDQSLAPVWKNLQQKKFSVYQKKSFDKALELYLSGLQELNQQQLASAKQKWQQTLEVLKALDYQEHAEIHRAVLNYETLILHEKLSLPALKNLMVEFDALKVVNTQSLEQVRHFLQESIAALEKDQLTQARFFLLTGFGITQALLPTESPTSASILHNGIQKANLALQQFLLSQIMSKEEISSSTASYHKILQNQPKEILKSVSSFIPVVLEEQKQSFHQNLEERFTCQQAPWDQVIPLFDRGYRALQRNIQAFDRPSPDLQIILGNYDEVLKDWQDALKLILHPPQKTPSPPSSSNKMTETVRSLQEMYLQDQSHPEKSTEEVHSW